MPEENKKIQKISDAQIVIASVAAALAAGLTFLAVPTQADVSADMSPTVVSRCEVVKTVVVKGACAEKGKYNIAEVVCGDGTKIILSQGKECKTSQDWSQKAEETCGKACKEKLLPSSESHL